MDGPLHGPPDAYARLAALNARPASKRDQPANNIQTLQQVVATHAILMTIQHDHKILTFGLLSFAFGPYITLLAGLFAFGLAGPGGGGYWISDYTLGPGYLRP